MAMAGRLSETKAASIKHAARARAQSVSTHRQLGADSLMARVARGRYHAVLALAAEVCGMTEEAMEGRLLEATID